jgi:hypothetical protein
MASRPVFAWSSLVGNAMVYLHQVAVLLNTLVSIIATWFLVMTARGLPLSLFSALERLPHAQAYCILSLVHNGCN